MNNRIFIITAGSWDHSSSRLRILQYIEKFSQDGYIVKHIPRVSTKPINFLDKIFFAITKRVNKGRILFSLIFSNFNILFVQRVCLGEVYLKYLKKGNIKIIYDFDDANYLLKEDMYNGKSKTGLMVNYASKVIVSTPFLSQFCLEFDKTPSIITTSIFQDRIQMKNPQDNKLYVIGWIGSDSTTQFLKVCEEGLKLLSKKINFKFILIGADPRYRIKGIEVVHYKWAFDKEAEYLQMFDIGIMPLTDTDFSAGKGGFKLFQYMAVGIPSVCTPIGYNKEIIIEGVNGFHANSPEEWAEKLFFLCNDTELRKKMGNNARKLFEENYTAEIAYRKLKHILETD